MAKFDTRKTNKEFDLSTKVNIKDNLGAYSEEWKIWELSKGQFLVPPEIDDRDWTSPDDENYITESQFVSKIYNSQNGIIAQQLLESKKFIDPFTNEAGILKCKPEFRTPTLEFESNQYFQKFLFKDYIVTYSYTEAPNQDQIFLATRREPKIDESTGQIKGGEVYLVYSRAGLPKSDGSIYETQYIFSRIDSNLATNLAGEFYQILFFIEPIQPINAKYIEFTPKTKGLTLTPNMFKIQVGGGAQVKGGIASFGDEKDDGALDYQILDLWMDKINGIIVDHHSTIGQELLFMEEFYLAFNKSNSLNNIGQHRTTIERVGISSTENFDLASDYNVWKQTSTFLGSNEMSEEWDDLISRFRLPEPYTQFDNSAGISSETGVLDIQKRNTKLWENSNKLFFFDIFLFAFNIPVIINGVEPFVSRPRENVNTRGVTREQRLEFVNKFIKGELVLGGLALNKDYPSTITDDFVSDIKAYTGEGDKFVLLKGERFKELYNTPKFVYYASFPIYRAGIGGQVKNMRLPNPEPTFAGGMLYNKAESQESKIGKSIYIEILSGSDSNVINQLTISCANGTFDIRYLDSNLDQAVGINGDDEEARIPPIKNINIQRIFDPTKTLLTLNYISLKKKRKGEHFKNKQDESKIITDVGLNEKSIKKNVKKSKKSKYGKILGRRGK